MLVPRAGPDLRDSDGFDSRLEPIVFDIYTQGGCCLEERKLTLLSPSITVAFSVQLKIS